MVFLLYDEKRVWDWFRGLFTERAGKRLGEAGDAAWAALTGFIEGIFVIACIHDRDFHDSVEEEVQSDVHDAVSAQMGHAVAD